jgi:hypothetical protein
MSSREIGDLAGIASGELGDAPQAVAERVRVQRHRPGRGGDVEVCLDERVQCRAYDRVVERPAGGIGDEFGQRASSLVASSSSKIPTSCGLDR